MRLDEVRLVRKGFIEASDPGVDIAFVHQQTTVVLPPFDVVRL